MTWVQRYIFALNERIVYLFIGMFIASGIGTVVLAQSRETIDAIDHASQRMSVMDPAQLLAVICILSLILAGWTQYMLLRLSRELHERPCYYKLTEKQIREGSPR